MKLLHTKVDGSSGAFPSLNAASRYVLSDIPTNTCSSSPKLNTSYNLKHHPNKQCKERIIWWINITKITILRPVKSAAALMLPIRCMFEANCVVITLPFASETCRSNEPATTDSLIDLPGDSTFVESLIILDWSKRKQEQWMKQSQKHINKELLISVYVKPRWTLLWYIDICTYVPYF